MRLRDYPYVIIRIACPECPRIGRYRLAVLAASHPAFCARGKSGGRGVTGCRCLSLNCQKMRTWRILVLNSRQLWWRRQARYPEIEERSSLPDKVPDRFNHRNVRTYKAPSAQKLKANTTRNNLPHANQCLWEIALA
jgi:hypothetical protein